MLDSLYKGRRFEPWDCHCYIEDSIFGQDVNRTVGISTQGPISRTDLSLLLGLNLIQSDRWLSLSLFVKLTPGVIGVLDLGIGSFCLMCVASIIVVTLTALCWGKM